MSRSQIAWAAAAAVLLFWAVGAYNRLVRLRGTLVQRYAPVDEQLRLRHALLLQLLEALAPVLQNAAPRLDALRAACQQVDAASTTARQRPGAAGAITSLRMADDILGEARARLPVQGAPRPAVTLSEHGDGEAGPNLAELNAQLLATDAALAFARRQFNEAVVAYNDAGAQFPTRLLVDLFGFRPAGLF